MREVTTALKRLWTRPTLQKDNSRSRTSKLKNSLKRPITYRLIKLVSKKGLEKFAHVFTLFKVKI